MKKSILTTISLLAILGIILFIYSCKKQTSQNELENPFNVKTTAVSLPVFPNLERINDHLRHLAFGTASLFDTIYLTSSNANGYISEMEKYADNKLEEKEFEYINNYINIYKFRNYLTGSSPFQYHFSMSDAINGSNTNYTNYNIRANLWAAYDPGAFAGFSYNNKEFQTTFGIPNYTVLKNDPSRLLKPIVVVPNELDGSDEMVLPIIGFYYDKLNDVVDTIMWQDEDDFEDDERFYIWVIDYNEKVEYNSGNNYNDCTGEYAPVRDDEYCDEFCGENDSMSPFDCSNRRKVWIETFQFVEDYKQRSSCGTKYNWLESKLGGRYEIGYSAMVVHGNGRAKVRGGVFNNTLQKDELVRSRKRGSCTYKFKNSNNIVNDITTLYWWDYDIHHPNFEEDKAKQEKAYLSKNYKPWRDTIYFMVYEYDLYKESRIKEVEIFYRNNKSAKLQYCTRKNQGPIGDKNHNKLIYNYNVLSPTYSSFPYTPQSNPVQVIMITPDSWPGKGLNTIASDEFEIVGTNVGGGSFPDVFSVKVKIKYDLL